MPSPLVYHRPTQSRGMSYRVVKAMNALIEPDIVVRGGDEVGEGPVWDEQSGVLHWVDIPTGAVHTLHPDGSTTDRRLPVPVGAVALRRDGSFVAALAGGFATIDPNGVTYVAPLPGVENGMRMNDGKCDPAGRFWAATMAHGAAPGAGTLYRLDGDLVAVPVVDGLSIPNGIDWSPDGRRMYYIDTPTYCIDVFDFDVATGAATNRSTLVRVPEDYGWPDGMTVDAEGFLWVAFWGGGAVRRYDPAGRVVGRIELPVTQVTSCTFGGPHLDELYITSAAAGLSDEERTAQPFAGALFRCKPGARGRPASRFCA